MSGFVELDVTRVGIKYLRDWLGDSPGLCSAIIPEVERQGEICALVPRGTSYDRATQFELGGLIKDAELDARWLFPYVLQKLRGRPKSALIVQDIWAEARDAKTEGPSFFVTEDGKSLYYYADGDNLVAATINNMLRVTISFVDVLFLFESCEIDFASQDRVIESCRVNAEAVRVSELIVRAYDQESFIVWRRVTPPKSN